MSDNENFQIRPATPEDVPVIFSLIKDLAEYERLSHEVDATRDMLRRELFGSHPAAEVVVAFLENKAIGFALFFTNFSTFRGRKGLYLEDLYVKPEFRGRGFGKALLVHLAKIAYDRNYARFEWSVLDWNEPSILFYKKLGAVPMDDWMLFRLSGDALEKLAKGR